MPVDTTDRATRSDPAPTGGWVPFELPGLPPGGAPSPLATRARGAGPAGPSRSGRPVDPVDGFATTSTPERQPVAARRSGRRHDGIAAATAAGGIATWLPDGRWEVRSVTEEEGDGGDQATRSRLRRRVGLVRWLARLAGWPRRVLAAALLLTAALVALSPDERPRPVAPTPPGVPVVVAARDLAAGARLSTRDLRTLALPTEVVPAGSAREPRSLLGRVVAGPVRRGEPVTDARLVGPGLTAGLATPELAAVPVRLADPAAATLVRPGDRVDVLATTVEGTSDQRPAGDAVQVAGGVRVLAVLPGRDAADGALLVLAATPAAARRLAAAAARQRLTVAVRPP